MRLTSVDKVTAVKKQTTVIKTNAQTLAVVRPPAFQPLIAWAICYLPNADFSKNVRDVFAF